VYKSVDKYDIKVVSWYQNLGVFRSSRCGIWGYWGYGDISIWLFVSKPRDIKCCYKASYPKYDFHVFFLRVFVILGMVGVSLIPRKFSNYTLCFLIKSRLLSFLKQELSFQRAFSKLLFTSLASTIGYWLGFLGFHRLWVTQ
jgi:hypothetical protein